jgi:hypothetical protein
MAEAKKPNRFQVTRIELDADQLANAANAMPKIKYTALKSITARIHCLRPDASICVAHHELCGWRWHLILAIHIRGLKTEVKGYPRFGGNRPLAPP